MSDDPIPLINRVPVPKYPVEVLPEVIADMVGAVAEATQTDPAMPGTAALDALAACTTGHVEIQLRQGWREPLGLYTATVAAPGERKSAVMRAMCAPLYRAESDLKMAGEATRKAQEANKAVAMKAADRQRNIAAAKYGTDEWANAMAEAIGAEEFAGSIQVPVVTRLIADDITTEAAGSLLAEQGGRLAILSAEGGVFDNIAGRYSAGSLPNLDLWLKAFSGDPYVVDRKGREPEYVSRAAMTVGLMIQPRTLENIAANRDFRGRGLLARFLYATPTSRVGTRTIGTPVPEMVEKDYNSLIGDLALALVGWSGDPAVIGLQASAAKEMLELENRVEKMLGYGGVLASSPSLVEWGAKLVGQIGRIAGILHVAAVGAEDIHRSLVSLEAVNAAIALGDYYRATAINVFAAMGADPSTADAEYLLDRILRSGEESVSERDMLRLARRLRSKAELAPALQRLLDHGWLTPFQQNASGERSAGRPSSPIFAINRTQTDGQKGQK